MAIPFNYQPEMAGGLNNTLSNTFANSINRHGAGNADLMNRTQYSQRLLKVLVEQTRDGHTKLLRPEMLRSNDGMWITFTRPDAMRNGRELQEGITPPGGFLTRGTIKFRIRQYGGLLYFTDQAVSLLNANPFNEAAQRLLEDAQLLMDETSRDIIHREAGMRVYATQINYPILQGERPHVAKTANAVPVHIKDITADNQLNYLDILQMHTQMEYMHLIAKNTKVNVALGTTSMNSLMLDPYFTIPLGNTGIIEM